VFHCNRQPLRGHRTENEASWLLENAAVKRPSVRSVPFQTERFIPAVKA